MKLASQAAWYRMENGPNSKNGKSWPKNRKWPSARNGEKMAQKWRKKNRWPKNRKWPSARNGGKKSGPKMAKKWDLGSFCYFISPFLGHFFPISDRGPFSMFWPIFSHFWSSARFHSIPGGLTRNMKHKSGPKTTIQDSNVLSLWNFVNLALEIGAEHASVCCIWDFWCHCSCNTTCSKFGPQIQNTRRNPLSRWKCWGLLSANQAKCWKGSFWFMMLSLLPASHISKSFLFLASLLACFNAGIGQKNSRNFGE